MDFAGEFESHITVAVKNCTELAALRQWCTANAVKFVHILLDRGATASQPMLTMHGSGTLSSELKAASEIGARIAAEGFQVLRVKIEVSADNAGVPLSDEEALELGAERYFEHHVKLLLESNRNTEELARQIEGFSAHLSRNAIRERTDGKQERFVTQRCSCVGFMEAQRRLKALGAQLQGLNLSILEVEEEFVVYDSNLALDAGWLQLKD